MIPESRFIEWLAMYSSDVEEAIDEIGDRFHRLLERTDVRADDPIVDNIREYMFSDPL